MLPDWNFLKKYMDVPDIQPCKDIRSRFLKRKKIQKRKQ